MLKIRASTHLLTEPDVCAKSSNPQLIAKLFSPASGIDTACDRSIVFFCSTISFSNNNIDTKTYEIIFHLHFICNLLFKCQLQKSLLFFEWGWEFRIEPYKLREFSIFCSAKHRLMKVTIADLSKFKSHKVSVFRKRKKTHLQCFLLRLLLLFIFIILKIMHQLLHNISVESTKFN